MKFILNRYIYTEDEVALMRKLINQAPGSTAKFKGLQLVKSQKQ